MFTEFRGFEVFLGRKLLVTVDRWPDCPLLQAIERVRDETGGHWRSLVRDALELEDKEYLLMVSDEEVGRGCVGPGVNPVDQIAFHLAVSLKGCDRRLVRSLSASKCGEEKRDRVFLTVEGQIAVLDLRLEANKQFLGNREAGPALLDLERTLGRRLPDDYRDFLLDTQEYDAGWVKELFPACSLLSRRDLVGEEVYLPIGLSRFGDPLCLSLATGEIVVFDQETPSPTLIAADFSSLRNQLSTWTRNTRLPLKGPDVLKLLLEGHFSSATPILAARHERDDPSFILAAIESKRERMFHHLVKLGFALDGALHAAARGGSEEIARFLVERVGMDVNERITGFPWTGQIPLHQASTREVAQYLIEAGSDLSLKDKLGDTPLSSPMNVFFNRDALDEYFEV